MPNVATIDGIQLPEGRPGKKYPRANPEYGVLEVKRGRKDPTSCVMAKKGLLTRNAPRMLDLCRQAKAAGLQITHMAVGSQKYNLDTGKPLESIGGTMDYEEELPMIEDLGFGAFEMFPRELLVQGGLALPAGLSARVINDLLSKYLGSKGWKKWLKLGLKLGLAVGGGRALWNYAPGAAIAVLSQSFNSAVYDDLLQPVLSLYVPSVFSAVEVETKLLGGLTVEEQRMFGATGVEDRPLLGESLPAELMGADDEEVVVMGSLSAMPRPRLASFLQ